MDILEKVRVYYKNFRGEKFVIGHSLQNRPIYCFKVQKTERPIVIIQCAMHAREHITASLCLRLINRFNRSAKIGTAYFIPMVNPDGVKIATTKNPLYKANGRGVDLNVNFDARWGLGKSNLRVSGAENYIGEYPFSEPESLALKDFTLKVKPTATISFHSKGEEIYWDFGQIDKDRERDFLFAQEIASITGYAVKSTPDSCGGYKDWCILHLKIPSLTIEVGSDSLTHPIGEEHLKEIYQKNKMVVERTMQFFGE